MRGTRVLGLGSGLIERFQLGLNSVRSLFIDNLSICSCKVDCQLLWNDYETASHVRPDEDSGAPALNEMSALCRHLLVKLFYIKFIHTNDNTECAIGRGERDYLLVFSDHKSSF